MFSQRSKVSLVLMMGAVALFVLLVMDVPSSKDWHAAKVVIPKKSNFSDVVRLLSAGNVLQHPVAFRLLVMGTLTGKHMRYGEYNFPEPPSAIEIWRKLYRGDVARYSVTIPEGSNLYEIANILENLELADPKKFLAAAASPEVLRRLDIPGTTAEGFLFPDTYLLEKSMSAEDILAAMARQFRRKTAPLWDAEAGEEGFSLLQLVTIASIIEKETGIAEEKSLISGIIRNRLSLGMPLQMDPTVIYGLEKFNEELTRRDLQTPNPYNTYLKRGLPPGPITNPGLSALRAAVFPAKTDYLYFVSRNDGSHQFSRTLAEHNQGVVSYQRDKTETED